MKEIELKDLRKEKEKHFLREDGCMVAKMYDDFIHYKDGNTYKEIDNTFEEKEGYYHNKNNSYKAYFKERSTGIFLKMELENHYLAYTLQKANDIEAKIEFRDSKLYQDIKYSNILDGIDFEYNVMPTKVKENILIHNKEALVDYIEFLLATDLDLVVNSDTSIEAYFEDKSIFKIEAPYILDKNGKKVCATSYALTKKGNHYVLQLRIDKEEIQKRALTYPIVIDPTITSTSNASSVYDTYIYPGDETVHRGSQAFLKVGVEKVDNQEVVNRALLKFDLPTIGTGSQIVYASLDLVGYPILPYSYDSSIINVHQVVMPWEEDTASWNTMHNQFSSRIEGSFDSARSGFDENNHVIAHLSSCELTGLVKKWYANTPNYGIMLKQNEEVYNSKVLPMFFSKNNTATGDNPKPILTVVYKNQNGVEPYMDYKIQNFGQGKSYVNTYNGNLTSIFEVASIKMGKFPISLNIVYNTNDVILNHNFGYGIGLSLNFHQTIVEKVIDNVNYLEYRDEDGTLHYFREINGIYKDEDGLDMTIEKKDLECILKDKSGNKMFFIQKGALFYFSQLQDREGNTTTITYDIHNRISKIVDASLAEINLSYENQKITVTSPNETTVLNYSSDKLVSRKTKLGVTTFSYNDKNGIESITDSNGLKIEYAYYNQIPYRIKKVTEIGLENKVGASFSMEYYFNSTTITDSNNRKEVITFNNYGNIASVRFTKEGDFLNSYSKTLEYGSEDNNQNTNLSTKNKLLKSAMLCRYVKNYLPNSSFEEENIFFTSTNGALLSVTNETSVAGLHSLKVVTTASNQTISQSIAIPKGKYYTFSFYMKGAGRARISLRYMDEFNQIQESIEKINPSEEFERYDVTTYYPESAVSHLTLFFVFDDSTTYYMDDIQLEEGEVANAYNLLSNSDFSNGLAGWTCTAYNRETGEDVNTEELFSIVQLENNGPALKMKMQPQNSTGISKSFPVRGKKGDTYVVSFLYKNEGYPAYDTEGAPILNNVIIRFNYPNTEYGHGIAPSKGFNPNEKEWQYFETRFQAEEDFDSMTLDFFQMGNANNLYITNICLFKDVPDTNYSYDEFGNLKQVKDFTNHFTSLSYNKNNQIIRVRESVNAEFNYEYDRETNQVLHGKSESGMHSKLFYDENQNCICHKTIVPSDSKIHDYCKIRIYGTHKYIRPTPLGMVITEEDSPHNDWYMKEEKGWHKLRHSILENIYLCEDNNLENVYLSHSDVMYCLIQFHYNLDDSVLMEVSNWGKYLKYDGEKIVLAPLEDDLEPFKFDLEYSDGLFLENNTEYTESGKAVKSTTDTLLHKTLYNIDEVSGLTNSITNPNGVTTSYIYNEMEQPTFITMKDKSVNYTYNAQNKLDKIIHENKTYQFLYDDFLNTKQIKLNGIVLVTNNYEQTSHNLVSSIYGNKQSISFIYDDFNRLQKKIREKDVYRYVYDSNGSLAKILSDDMVIKYGYDRGKRLLNYTCNDFKIKYEYDRAGNVISKKYVLGNHTHRVNHTFKEEDIVTKTIFDNEEINYEYDKFNRLNKTTGILEEEYSYVTNGKRTSTLVKQRGSYSYIYNRLNHITHIYNNGILEHRYDYDAYSELIKEDNYVQNQTIIYTYNQAGNLLSKKVYTLNTNNLLFENTYEYENSNWEDQLTKFNDTEITYDEIGNPLTIGDAQFIWINGRQLKEYHDFNVDIEYKYNMDGIRTRKRVNGIETNYYVEGAKIIFEQIDNSVLYYMYSEIGEVIGLQYNNTPYYYIKNNQNDIIGIIDIDKNVVAKYTYDAWGNILSITDDSNHEITDTSHIGHINPFRYRSYYYDTETKLYYLNSRYYHPLWGRFINADGIIGANEDILSYNLYAYVSNNPVNNVDTEGEFALTLFSAVLLSAAMMTMAIVAGKTISNALSGTDLALPSKKQLTLPDLTKSKEEVRIQSKVTSNVAAISKAKENTTSKDVTKPCTPAVIKNGDVVRLKPRMDIPTTVRIVKRGSSVMCDDKKSAELVASYFPEPRGPEMDMNKKPGNTYYNHYHPDNYSHRHIWYYN